MGERGCRCRVGQVVRRDVNCLYRGDRTRLGGGDALLQGADLVCQGGLVADRRRHASHQCRNLGTCLYIAENIVDEQQHVLLLAVAEVLGHGQTGQCNAHTCSGRLIHLTEHQRGLVQNARLLHLAPQVVALTSTLTNAGENGVTAVLGSDVADELLN